MFFQFKKMINQEEIFQLIFHGHWKALTTILHRQKENIEGDALLTHAAQTFEQQFLKQVVQYPLNDQDTITNLEQLYLLHHGNFYKLKEENYKQVVLELVQRKPLKEAYNYARLFPDEAISKQVIKKFEETNTFNTPKEAGTPVITERVWIEIYNRLFELINNQSDTATYFSGPKFINTVREFSPYHPTYEQYIAQRNREGKSTSRKIFYYDILFELPEVLRQKVVSRILEMVRPFDTDRMQPIEQLLNTGNPSKISRPLQPKPDLTVSGNPIVFISYSWDGNDHENWVLTLAERLAAKGIDVILDKYYLRAGKNLPHFVEQSIAKADRVLIIFTPNYKAKADGRYGGVGYEYSIMNASLYKAQTTNEKIIPVLRTGTMADSIPEFMQQFIHLDMRKDENFETSFNDLVREIYNEPAIKKPSLGSKPNFN